jgi:hypothetical protein
VLLEESESKRQKLEIENMKLTETEQIEAQKMKTMRHSYNLMMGINPVR